MGSFEDGALKHNNPVDIAVWECKHIWPELVRPDIVLSLGTGHSVTATSPRSASPQSALKDKFVFRLWRSFMTSIDGQSAWRDLMNRLGDEDKARYHRLTIVIPGPNPAPDDYESIDRLVTGVLNYDADNLAHTAALVGLQISSFYLQLDKMPVFNNGFYICEATIRCQSAAIVGSFLRLSSLDHEFCSGPVHLASLSPESICADCNQYGQKIEFVARTLDEIIDIHLCPRGAPGQSIGAMPRSLSWFIAQQRLNCPFGTSDPYQAATCSTCRPKAVVIRWNKRSGSPGLDISSKRQRS